MLKRCVRIVCSMPKKGPPVGLALAQGTGFGEEKHISLCVLQFLVLGWMFHPLVVCG